MKAVSDKKKQKHLAGRTGPMPVDVTIPSKTSAETEDYQFTPAAVGRDIQSALDLLKARSSPYDDQDFVGSSEGSDEEDEDEDSDESDDDDDEEE